MMIISFSLILTHAHQVSEKWNEHMKDFNVRQDTNAKETIERELKGHWRDFDTRFNINYFDK